MLLQALLSRMAALILQIHSNFLATHHSLLLTVHRIKRSAANLPVRQQLCSHSLWACNQVQRRHYQERMVVLLKRVPVIHFRMVQYLGHCAIVNKLLLDNLFDPQVYSWAWIVSGNPIAIFVINGTSAVTSKLDWSLCLVPLETYLLVTDWSAGAWPSEGIAAMPTTATWNGASSPLANQSDSRRTRMVQDQLSNFGGLGKADPPAPSPQYALGLAAGLTAPQNAM